MISKFAKISLLVLFPLSLLSCAGDDGYSTVCRVERTDFEHVLTAVGEVDAVKSVSINCPNGLDATVVFLVEDGAAVKKGDTVCLLEDIYVAEEYENAVLEIEKIEAGFEKAKIDLAAQYEIMQADVRNNEAEMAMASVDSLQLQFLSPVQRKIRELELRQKAITNEKLRRKLQSLEVINRAELRKIEMNMQRFKIRMDKLREAMASQTVISPTDGIAVRSIYQMSDEPLKEGDNVWGSMQLLSIPDVSRMKVRMALPENEYKLVEVGDSVSYTFDAVPGVVASGRITYKASVGKPVARGSKVKLYEVEGSVDGTAILPEPGISAVARIVVERVPDTLVLPRVAVFEEDSTSVVYLVQGKGFQRREVETCMASGRDVVIARGVEAGQTVAMIRPKKNRIVSQEMFVRDVAAADSLVVPADSAAAGAVVKVVN